MEADIQNRVLKEARALFFSNGYSKVSMDDIARKLGMSKKTIYKYYNSKHELLVNVFNDFNQQMVDGLDAVEQAEWSFITKLKLMLTFIGLTLADVTPVFLEDMRQNSPDIWRLINKLKLEAAFMRFSKLIDEGIATGQINTDINKGLAVALYASAINNLMDPVFLNALPDQIQNEMPQSLSEVFDKTVNIIFDGILTSEAKEEYEKALV